VDLSYSADQDFRIFIFSNHAGCSGLNGQMDVFVVGSAGEDDGFGVAGVHEFSEEFHSGFAPQLQINQEQVRTLSVCDFECALRSTASPTTSISGSQLSSIFRPLRTMA